MSKSLIFIFLIFLSRCSTAQESQSSVVELYEFTYDQIAPVIQSSEAYKPFARYVKHGIKAYKISYESQMEGRSVVLSGSILIPLNQTNPGIAVFCHGTQFDQNVSSNWNSPLHIEALPALNGHITFLPDYLGYGVSAGQVPAYFDKENSLHHLEDFIQSGLKFLEEKGLSHRRELDLIGFSQGGHLVLSFAENHAEGNFQNLSIRNVISIGGPTDIAGNLLFVTQQTTFEHSGYVPYLLAVHNHHHWKKKWSTFFVSPYDQVVNQFINEEITLQQLNEQTPNEMGVFLKPAFRMESELFNEIANHLNEQSIGIFRTDIPLTLIHSNTDEDVPFNLLDEFYRSMKQRNGEGTTRLLKVQGNHQMSGLIGMTMALDVISN